jgi:hypothetical protein
LILGLSITNNEKRVSIYILTDPRDSTAFYVGATSRTTGHRLSSHIHEAVKLQTKTEKSEIIRNIMSDGCRPEITEIESAGGDEWAEAEQFWMEYFRSIGCVLVNISLGGAGAFGARQTESTRKLRREVAIGRDMKSIHTEAIWEANAAKKRHRIKIDGVIYGGIKVASVALGRPYSTVQNMLDTGRGERLDGPKVGYEKTKVGMASGSRHGNSRPVVIDGKEYWGLTGAAREIGVHLSTIQGWLKCGKAEYADMLP